MPDPAGSPFDCVQRRNNLTQREVRLLTDEGEIRCECFSSGEVLPPRGIGSQVPSSRKRCTHLIAELTLTSNCSAASRRDPPPSTKRMTRTLSSPGYGPCIGQPSGDNALNSLLRQTLGIPIHSGRDVL